jgi:2-polyprenyl-3-methyl-5-hydroxy-6-metoxy-1,4-benzoquinol methylase
LARINLLSLAARRVWTGVRELPFSPDRPFRILDVACGGGDVAIALKRRADREGLKVEVEGCDLSSTALDFARSRARALGVEVTFVRRDVLGGDLPGGFDLVCSSLFLHHLSNQEAVGLLRTMSVAGRAVLVQDLLRTRTGLLMALATVRLVTRSRIVRVDGPRSVRAAFTPPEVRSLAGEAGLEGARVEACWPERFVLKWEPT